MSQYDWIQSLLRDIDSFARMNCLPKTANSVQQTLVVAEAELTALGVPLSSQTAENCWPHTPREN